ncbi:hypothetical protein OS189_12105 [Sulfitobacter sp. F26169L]|uniref:hypothetical protein n=1 Tax=Sulfitobacter sp. F26169L TaxID=2996015 RepID=UPI002260F6AC|nr:hypothetical protein [Sulfitobacter sp. F26169L]MCX7567086.1 hypothetical protein [Sulfitobacter sp. F26169L]
MIRVLSLALLIWPLGLPARQLPNASIASTEQGAVALESLAGVVRALDPDVVALGPTLQFTIDGIAIMNVADMLPLTGCERWYLSQARRGWVRKICGA